MSQEPTVEFIEHASDEHVAVYARQVLIDHSGATGLKRADELSPKEVLAGAAPSGGRARNL